MQTQKIGLAKVDHALAELLREKLDQERSTFPVVITCKHEAGLEQLLTMIESYRGELRHRHDLLLAASAWLPLSAVEPLAELEFVEELELDQPSAIA